MMKKILKIVLCAAMTFTAAGVSAQKMGRVNVQALLVVMPETIKMQADLETIRQDFSDNFETMQVELNNKIADYQKNETTMNESVRSLKEKEMQDLNLRMQQFEQTAVQELQTKQNQMLEPIIAKAKDAISVVAKDGGYSIVHDESMGAVAYFDDSVVDLMPLVKTKLGIKE